MDRKEKAKFILNRLYKIYPHSKTALKFSSPWELLVAAILSAQATDKLVNQVTPTLFKRFKTIKDFANASLEEIDKEISKVNFHHNKAKSIKGAAQKIMEKFNGKVPDNMADLDSLPGIARKTANVILGDAFFKNEGIAVDTHVIRLSKKLGLTTETDPVKIERDLMKIVPRKNWSDFSQLLISHGRDICTARAHSCNNCPLLDLCPEK